MSRARAEPAVDPEPPPAAEEPRDLETLYRRNARWLRAALLRRFGSRRAFLVDDLVQESFLRAARLADLSAVRAPRALLAKIAGRLVLDEVRRAAVRSEAAAALGGRSHDAAPADQEQFVLLKQVVLSMPERYRTVFLLARFEGLSQAQIAERLGLTEKAVEWRLTRALAHCADALGR